MNDYLVTKLKEGRLNKGLKQSDVTKFTGIKNTTLSNYENGITEPDIDTFLQLCELYDIDYAEILGEAYGLNVQGSDFDIKPSEIDHIKQYRDLDDHGRESVNIILDRETLRVKALSDKDAQLADMQKQITALKIQARLRLYTYMGKIACAGTGFYFDDIPTDTIEAPYMNGTDFIIGVSGDSMEPNYHDGEKLYVQKVSELTLGDVGIFTIHNECFIKELGERGLISRNPDYDDIEGTEDVRLIGRVLGKVEN